RVEEVRRKERVERRALELAAGGEQRRLQLLDVVRPLRFRRVGEESRRLRGGAQLRDDRLAPSRRDRELRDACALGLGGDAAGGLPGERPGELLGGDAAKVELRDLDGRLEGATDLLQPLEERAELERGEEPPHGI